MIFEIEDISQLISVQEEKTRTPKYTFSTANMRVYANGKVYFNPEFIEKFDLSISANSVKLLGNMMDFFKAKINGTEELLFCISPRDLNKNNGGIKENAFFGGVFSNHESQKPIEFYIQNMSIGKMFWKILGMDEATTHVDINIEKIPVNNITNLVNLNVIKSGKNDEPVKFTRAFENVDQICYYKAVIVKDAEPINVTLEPKEEVKETSAPTVPSNQLEIDFTKNVNAPSNEATTEAANVASNIDEISI